MCDIGNEVSELCESILNFQTHINIIKEKLFLLPQVCDTLIWNHIVGAETQFLKKEHLYEYFYKTKTKFTIESVELLFYEHSTTKHQYLTRKQFISIFLNESQSCIYEIMATRKAKYSYANNHVPHFKITDFLVEILSKTLDFLETKEKMKRVIYAKNSQFLDFKLTKVDPEQQDMCFTPQFSDPHQQIQALMAEISL